MVPPLPKTGKGAAKEIKIPRVEGGVWVAQSNPRGFGMLVKSSGESVGVGGKYSTK